MDHARGSASPSSPLGSARSHTITNASWERTKSDITKLFVERGLPLKHVMSVMEAEHGFTATHKQYMSQLKKWGIQKNVKSSEMEYIHRKAQSRLQEGKDTVFFINGKIIDPAKIERWKKRNANADLAPRRDTSSPSPIDITWRTPSPEDFATRPSASLVQGPELPQNDALDLELNSIMPVPVPQYPDNTRPSIPFGTTNEDPLAKNATVAHESLTLLRHKEPPSMQNQASRSRQDQVATNVFETASPKANSRGFVILIHWQNDKNGSSVLLELNKLAELFQEVFGLDTEIWAIPDQNCQFQVHFKILEFAQKSEKDTLLIVYYAGHGKLTDRFRLEWVSSQKADDSSYKTVKWSGIQSILEEAESNVLIILDCCLSLSTSPEGRGVMEFLAASAFEFQSSAIKFSSVLLDELMALASYWRPFTIAKLYNRILQNMQRRWHVGQALPVTPVHIRSLEGEKFLQDITLSPVGITQQHPMSQQMEMDPTPNSALRASPPPLQSRSTLPSTPQGTRSKRARSGSALRNQDLPIMALAPVEEHSHRGTWNGEMGASKPWRPPGAISNSFTIATDSRGTSVDNTRKRFTEIGFLAPTRDASVTSTTGATINFEPSIPQKRKRDNAPPPARIYQCTHIYKKPPCNAEFSRFGDWVRHEENHYPQKQWVCQWSGKDGQNRCSRHNHPFKRKDHLREHLKMVHNEPTIDISSWVQVVESDWKRQCGFCGAVFENWNTRCEHIGNHFQEGARVASWNDPWPENEECPDHPGTGDDEDGDDDGEGGRADRMGSVANPTRSGHEY